MNWTKSAGVTPRVTSAHALVVLTVSSCKPNKAGAFAQRFLSLVMLYRTGAYSKGIGLKSQDQIAPTLVDENG
jgi:hypothetical protein